MELIYNTNDIWNFVKKELKCDKEVNPDIYNLYISKTELYQQVDKNLIISTNNKFSKDIILAMNKKINLIIRNKFNLTFNIEYKYLTSDNSEIKINSIISSNNNDYKKKPQKNSNLTYNTSKTGNGNYNKFDKLFNFSNFIRGDSNNEAFSAAKEVAKKPGIKWNPLFINMKTKVRVSF